MDAKEFRKRIENLYSGVDPTNRNQDDKYLINEELRRIKIGETSALRWTDEEYREGVSKKISETYSSNEMRQMQASKSKPHTAKAKEKIRTANLGLKHDKDRVEKMSKKRRGQAVYHKCFMTPSGAFPSKKEAIKWALANGVRNPSGKFDKWIKERPAEFYYIKSEEYEQIKDNPKLTDLPWMQNSKRLKKYR